MPGGREGGWFQKVDYPIGQQNDNMVMREPRVLAYLLAALFS